MPLLRWPDADAGIGPLDHERRDPVPGGVRLGPREDQFDEELIALAGGHGGTERSGQNDVTGLHGDRVVNLLRGRGRPESAPGQGHLGRRLAKARLPEGVAGIARLHAMIGEQFGEDADEDDFLGAAGPGDDLPQLWPSSNYDLPCGIFYIDREPG
ncbi:MAG: hypothetical protein ACLQDY_18500 [Streptosporangiaceae bacterium]